MDDEQLNLYQQEGWCVEHNVIPRELIDEARQEVAAILDQPDKWPEKHFQYLDPAVLPHPQGGALPGGIQRPVQMADVFRRISEHPALVQAMASLLGGPVVLHTDQIGVKFGAIEGEQGGRSYHHQDSWYWKLPPRVGCNCWIPLHEVGPDAIALAIMPSTQAAWQLTEHESYFDSPSWGRFAEGQFQPFRRHRIPLNVVAAYQEEEVLMPLQPGDGLFFTNYTWHRSEPNRSGEDKAFYAIAYRLKDA